MAVVHQAYSFDPVAFHRDLWKSIAPTGSLSMDLFRQVAKRMVHDANPDVKNYLRLICFDEDWLIADDDDSHRFTDLYLIALGAYIDQSCPLTNLSFAALELALPKLACGSMRRRLGVSNCRS